MLTTDFPNLAQFPYAEKSPASTWYNCVAWAAGKTDEWWDPNWYWPESVPREATMAAWIKVFEALGFSICEEFELEPGYEKVAIYARGSEPKHVARQLPSGQWTSKLGSDVDIEHTLEGLEGVVYGTVVCILKRRI